jgi:hypothetical protein
MHRIIYYHKSHKHKTYVKSSKAALDYILSLVDKPIGFTMTKRRVDESPSSYGYYLVDGKGLTAVSKSDFFEWMELV